MTLDVGPEITSPEDDYDHEQRLRQPGEYDVGAPGQGLGAVEHGSCAGRVPTRRASSRPSGTRATTSSPSQKKSARIAKASASAADDEQPPA